MSNHEKFIKKVFNLASKAKGRTSSNPLVGCLIVKNNKIIARGYHKKYGANHAEIDALKKCGLKSRGAIMYVNLEPCNHQGKTPPCVDAVIKSEIKEIVISMRDPNPKTNGKSIIKLKKAGIKVIENVLRDEAFKLNEVFIKNIKTKMPFIVAKTAQTLDGKIATSSGQSKWITAAKTRQYAHQRRDDFDAILVGINTVLKDNPRLNGVVKSKSFKKVVLDSSLKISLNANLFKGVSTSNIYIATTKEASIKKINLLKKKGINVLCCPQKQGKIDLNLLFSKLLECNITSILIEGGANVVGSALKQNLVDKINVYVAPKIIGDQAALNSVVGIGIKDINKAVKLTDLTIKQIDKDFLIEAYVHRNH
jgi:diaminohydroxyphosphoribosylaminopyrimidine deaminase/5-amino-6-(5-phosphoribosylamino)uracil reductase